jgi:hypothetical protein
MLIPPRKCPVGGDFEKYQLIYEINNYNFLMPEDLQNYGVLNCIMHPTIVFSLALALEVDVRTRTAMVPRN